MEPAAVKMRVIDEVVAQDYDAFGYPIKPREPMAFPESVTPEFIRDDVADAVIDALALHLNPNPFYKIEEDWSSLGMSDSVNLPPLELRF